ncbi:MAG: threonine synthase [Armatimonadota bacterium]
MSDATGTRRLMGPDWPGVIEAYKNFLPVTDDTPRVTLLEGNTPLIRSEHIGPSLPVDIDLYFKYEGANPTGSFKDRGMTMAVSKAKERGVQITMCASTGNTSAAAAAYSARAGMQSVVLIPEGKIAFGKLSQALIHGARTVQVDGNFDACLRIVREITDKYPIELVNSLNPMRMEGQKTASFEICDALQRAPDIHILPVGNAGNISAYWWGYQAYHEAGIIDNLPKMIGFQAAGAAPLVHQHPVEEPETIATAIRIGDPARWEDAVNAMNESGGRVGCVTDEKILQAYQMLAGREGIFCEPASATSLAGLLQLINNNDFEKGPVTVVCTLTGHGLKDPDTAVDLIQEPEKIAADTGALIELLGLEGGSGTDG